MQKKSKIKDIDGHYKKLLLKYMDLVLECEGVFFLFEDNDWQSELIKLWKEKPNSTSSL